MGYNITKELQIKVIGTNYTKMKQVFKKELGPDFDFEYFYNIYRTWMQNQIEKNGIKAKKLNAHPSWFLILIL